MNIPLIEKLESERGLIELEAQTGDESVSAALASLTGIPNDQAREQALKALNIEIETLRTEDAEFPDDVRAAAKRRLVALDEQIIEALKA